MSLFTYLRLFDILKLVYILNTFVNEERDQSLQSFEILKNAEKFAKYKRHTGSLNCLAAALDPWPIIPHSRMISSCIKYALYVNCHGGVNGNTSARVRFLATN